jgi:NSS family neurotransmitter:Na+ symporter
MAGTARPTFASRYGAIITLIGVAVGLGNVWRFPYMVGQFGGAAFVLLYVLIVVVIGIPALWAELALGRHTRRGPVGAFAAGGLPGGRAVGWFLFLVVTAATGYYAAVVGWVAWYGIAELLAPFGMRVDAAAILPPDAGVDHRSLVRVLACTAGVIAACALVMQRGLRKGIERVSTIIMPLLLIILLVILVRSVTLPGAMEGVRWLILKVRFEDITANVTLAAIGQVVFSLSLGGTFMVVYGSYLAPGESLRSSAMLTAVGDTASGLLAGLAIMPAVFALGLEPSSGPGLLFSTMPGIFATIPGGWAFGLLFYFGLFGAGYLSAIAALETLVAGLTDNTSLTRPQAIWLMAGLTFLVSIPPSINNGIFVPWDLTFGSGMQTLGSLLAVVTFGWCVNRTAALEELNARGERPVPPWLFAWIRFGIPTAILVVGVWWFVTSVLGVASEG